MKAKIFYKLFKMFLWLTIKFRELSMMADPYPQDVPIGEVENWFGTAEQNAWHKKYHVPPMGWA
jgi:hypothetical protein